MIGDMNCNPIIFFPDYNTSTKIASNVTIGTTASTYTMTTDCVVQINVQHSSGDTSGDIYIKVNNKEIGWVPGYPYNTGSFTLLLKKGDIISVYRNGGSGFILRSIYTYSL